MSASSPPDRRITRNVAECSLCGDVIESQTRHDFVTCGCGEIAVDGGHAYLRRAANNLDNVIDRSEFSDEL